jgi:hypothetical protein
VKYFRKNFWYAVGHIKFPIFVPVWFGSGALSAQVIPKYDRSITPSIIKDYHYHQGSSRIGQFWAGVGCKPLQGKRLPDLLRPDHHHTLACQQLLQVWPWTAVAWATAVSGGMETTFYEF